MEGGVRREGRVGLMGALMVTFIMAGAGVDAVDDETGFMVGKRVGAIIVVVATGFVVGTRVGESESGDRSTGALDGVVVACVDETPPLVLPPLLQVDIPTPILITA